MSRDPLLDVAPELARAESRPRLVAVRSHGTRRFPASFSSQLCALLSKDRAELTQDERKWLAPELIAACGESFAECGRIANRDRRTMHDYVNPELRGKTMPDEVIDALEDYAAWKISNARFARMA
jgi:hypothetical protein